LNRPRRPSCSTRAQGHPPARTAVLVALLLAGIAGAWPGVALADDEAARQHFRRGVDLYDRKQYAPALEAFHAAYAEKPSPGIKQNIALCLKGQGKLVEAATAFDEALDEGRDSLKPETRAQIERELAALSKSLGTLTLRIVEVVSPTERRPIDGAQVTVDGGAALSPAALKRPIRLEPGIHVLKAQIKGFPDPPDKKLSILAGSPVDASFEVGVPGGTLTIRPSVADARVRLDNVDYAPGVWSGKVAEGTHHVEVSAPGYHVATADVIVTNGASVEYPISLIPTGEIPPPYDPPPRKPPPAPKKLYLVPMVAGGGESMRPSAVLGERLNSGTKRSFSGASVGARFGYRLSGYFALELYGEAGRMTAAYDLDPPAGTSARRSAETAFVHWQITPSMRFTTAGKFRFTLGTGLGVHGLSVEWKDRYDFFSTTADGSKKGSGVGASWLLDGGIQFDVGSLFLEAVGMIDMHGVGTVTEDGSDARMFLSSPATRFGVRLGLGIPF